MQNLETGELEQIDNLEQLKQAIENDLPVFKVGEILNIKGGTFRIKSFGKKFMMLEGLPGTKCLTASKPKNDENGKPLFVAPVEAKVGGRLK